jgi:hypothetical protein
MARVKRDPKTKEQLLDRMLSFDFDGDIRHLGEDTASIVRTGANTLLLTFPTSGITFELEVHRPREFSKAVVRSMGGERRSFAPAGEEGATRRLERVTPEEPAEETKPKRRYTRREERKEA